MLRVGWSETNVRMQAIEEENRQLRQTVERLSKIEDVLKTELWPDERSETTCSGPEQPAAVSPCNQILIHHACVLKHVSFGYFFSFAVRFVNNHTEG